MRAQASATPAAGAAAPAGLRHRRFRLTGGAPSARAAVTARAVIGEWQLPADRALAAVLASDLVISAAVNGAGTAKNLTLSVRCTGTRFRVEVHDAPVRGDLRDAASGTGAQRGLLLAAARAAGSGRYRAPAGRAVFYVPEFPLPDAATGSRQSRREPGGDGEPVRPPRRFTVPALGTGGHPLPVSAASATIAARPSWRGAP